MSGLDLNFQGHLSCRTSEIENSPVPHELTPVRAVMSVNIIFLIIDLSCRTSVIIIQPVPEAIFQNFYLSGMVGQSLRSSPACCVGLNVTMAGSAGIWQARILEAKFTAVLFSSLFLITY